MEEVMDIKNFFGMYGTFQEDMLNLIVFLFTKQIRKDFPEPYKKRTLRKREWSTCHETSTERFFSKRVMGQVCYVTYVHLFFQCIKKNFLKKRINIFKF